MSVRLAKVEGRLSISEVEHRRVLTELGKEKLKLSSLHTLKIAGKSNRRLSRPESRSDPIGGSEPSSRCETQDWDSLPDFFF